MKKYIMVIIFGIVLGCVLENKLYRVSVNRKQYKFKFCGNKKLYVNLPKTKFGYVEDASINKLKYGIVNNPMEAAIISKLIIDDIYGEGNMKCPIIISRNNSEIWSTEGTQNPVTCGGGTVTLSMLRSNCKIIFFMGTK